MNDETEKQTQQAQSDDCPDIGETLPPPELQEDPQHYTPRPTWQRILAWMLVVLLVIGIIGYYYWIMYRY